MIETILNWLFPKKCPFCHTLREEAEEELCAACQKNLPWALGAQGEQKVEFTKGCVSPLFYREGVKSGVARFKFQNCPGYAGVFAMLMAQAVRDRWPGEDSLVVSWVPLSPRRRRKRGYNQAECLARALGERLGLPAQELLVKPRDNLPQSRQETDGARRVNVLGAYEMAPGVAVAGRCILLVDDVVTTGATLSECARILRTAGAEAVYCATLARARN